MEKYILSVVVQNNAGVLARVSSLFGRRGYNIDSLTVSATTDPRVSRITIVVTGDDAILEQIIKQVSKLEETIVVRHLVEQEAYCRELVFVKLQAEDATVRDSAREVAQIYGANVVLTEPDHIVLELTETPSRIDAFLSVIANFKVVETCRSGVTAMVR
ncbi:acetolactate synthase small subunit [Intestinibacillus massiliensis]|uniref:acetolactate synthase small subunit n=1 Tax=Intestinibacillus massiliensis TaxID=1871029 RepID=UPI000B351F2B|nr:acetolactate synthase small subunit [Intestinibacillus massiliensis]MCB6364824.1 acetolactate synthase small subunit [Intestinibacillus massiliensis]